MKCRNIEILLSDMLEARLDEKILEKVNDHLGSCPSCREKLDKLRNYKFVVSRIESQDVPPALKDSILESIANEKGKARPSYTRKLTVRSGIAIAAMAASVLLLVSIKPFSEPLLKLDSSFSFFMEKRGKGPLSERIYEKGSDPRIDKVLALADSTGTKVSKTVFNKASGQIDCLILRIPASNYSTFRELYNTNRGADSLPLLPDSYRRKYVRLQVYIPGRSFFTGDFNGDKHVDFGLYFNRGKYSGRIFISINRDGNFEDGAEALTGNEALSLKPGDKIRAGDFNGDGLDDLMLCLTDNSESKRLEFLINTGNNSFTADREFTFEKTDFDKNTWKEFLAGDFNGDGYDDIAVVEYRGEHKGLFNIYINTKDMGFRKPYIFRPAFEGMERDSWFTPLVMDINGDKLADPGIYWQSGERDAYWYFSINHGDGSGSESFHAGFGKGYMAFMGTYLPLCGDTDGDGYDELLVKLGVADEISEWYLMQNRQDSTFAMGKAILFNGERDIIIR